MPVWSSTPPKAQAGYPHRIVRTPAEGTLTAVVTCPAIIGTITHFLNNRTTPCEGQGECGPCSEGFAWRWHGYVSALVIANLEHIIFEFTANAGDPFKNYEQLHQTLRACKFTARRPSKRHNGRIVIGCTALDEQRLRIPDPPNVAKVLCHIWNVPYGSTETKQHAERLGEQLRIGLPKGNGQNS